MIEDAAVKSPLKRAPKTGQIDRTIRTVLDATTSLLAEVGYRRLTFDMISQRSGVSRSTLYRHWPKLPDLVASAFDSAVGTDPVLVETGNLREELLQTYHLLARDLKRTIWGKLLPVLIEAAHLDPQFNDIFFRLVERRRLGSRKLFYRAIERGEIPADTKMDWILDMVSGLLYHRLLVTGGSLREDGMIEWAVDSALSQVDMRPA